MTERRGKFEAEPEGGKKRGGEEAIHAHAACGGGLHEREGERERAESTVSIWGAASRVEYVTTAWLGTLMMTM